MVSTVILYHSPQDICPYRAMIEFGRGYVRASGHTPEQLGTTLAGIVHNLSRQTPHNEFMFVSHCPDHETHPALTNLLTWYEFRNVLDVFDTVYLRYHQVQTRKNT